MTATIEDLPNEVLSQILEKLDFESKLRAQFVTNRWSQLVFENTKVLVTDYLDEDIPNEYMATEEPLCIIDTNLFMKSRTDPGISRTLYFDEILFSNTISKFSRLKVLFIWSEDFALKTMLPLITNSCDKDLQQILLYFPNIEPIFRGIRNPFETVIQSFVHNLWTISFQTLKYFT